MKWLIPSLVAVLAGWVLFTGCSGSGGGGGNGGGSASGARPWAIDDTAFTGNGDDLLEGGDMFIGENDLTSAMTLGDQIWATLVSTNTWTAPGTAMSYQFFFDTDPNTNWGRAYRYTGQNVVAGPVIGAPGFYGTGTYVRANGQAYDAVILRTWDNSY